MNAPERYYHVSQTQLSIALHYGGATVNGAHYIYDPTDDVLIRADVLKREAQSKKTKRVKGNSEDLEK